MQSLVTYPDRGPWGDADYPGSCAGALIRDLMQFYRPKRVADPCEGSGTTRAVCADLRLPYFGTDLREGYDLAVEPLTNVLPWVPDFIVLHPPYFQGSVYSGEAWGEAWDKRDLSHEDDWDRYLSRLRGMVDNCRRALGLGGRLAVLIGDTRSFGRYYSAQAAVVSWFPPEIIQAVIVTAGRIRPDRMSYIGRYIRVVHEYVIVLDAPRAGHGG